ncbi:MAG: hypothetical protein ACOCQR_00120 [bacterium]
MEQPVNNAFEHEIIETFVINFFSNVQCYIIIRNGSFDTDIHKPWIELALYCFNNGQIIKKQPKYNTLLQSFSFECNNQKYTVDFVQEKKTIVV